MNQLATGDNSLIDPKQYRAFYHTLVFFMVHDPVHKLYNTALLDLHHPVEPSPESGLEFLAAVTDAPPGADFTHEWLNPPNTKVGNNAFWFLVKLAQCLNRRQQRDLARTVIDFGVSRFPAYFRAGKPETFGSAQRETLQQKGFGAYGAGARKDKQATKLALERRGALLAALDDMQTSKRSPAQSTAKQRR